MDEPSGRTPGPLQSRTAATADSKRRLCRNCVRWAWNRRRVPTNNESHRGTSWKRKSLIRLRKEACRYHLVSVAKIAFQACFFSIRTLNASAPYGLRALVAAQLKSRHSGVQGIGSGDRCTADAPQQQHDIVTAVRSTEWVGDFRRLESTTWRWWTRTSPVGTH